MDFKQKSVQSPLEYWAMAPTHERMMLRVGREILIANPAKAEVLSRTRIETSTWAGVEFSRDGNASFVSAAQVAWGKLADCFVHVLDAQTGSEIARLESTSAFQFAAFTPDGRAIVAVSRGLAMWDLPELGIEN